MKITAPLGAVGDVGPLMEAGADELYCGVRCKELPKEYVPNGRRQPNANLGSFEELSEVLKRAHARGGKVWFCANTPQEQEHAAIQKDEILRACHLGADGLVIADFTMLPWVRQIPGKRKIILSTLCPSLNSMNTVFMAKRGVDRIVLERQLTLAEISDMVDHARKLGLPMEFEAFAAPLHCVHINGFCHFHKKRGTDPNPCRSVYDLRRYVLENGVFKAVQGQTSYVSEPFRDSYCTICHFRELARIGVEAIKLVGRNLELPERLKQVRYMKDCVQIAIQDGQSEAEMRARMKERFQQFFGKPCGERLCFWGDHDS